MEINIDREKKVVDIWLTNAEKNDPATNANLKQLYAHYKARKYLIATFMSGHNPLEHNMMDLLKYNQRRSAERTAQLSIFSATADINKV